MNRIITYFKQAYALMRQEKLFSAIYILGTGLSIAVVMALSIVVYIKIAPVYPETNRNRMLIMSYGVEKYGENSTSLGGISYQFIKDHLKTLKTPEAVSAYARHEGSSHYVRTENSLEQTEVQLSLTDEMFWRVFEFRFREGAPYTAADVQSAIPAVVIARSLARRLFGEETAVGRYVVMDMRSYRVCGVVDDASWVTQLSYAQIYAPYSTDPDIAAAWGTTGYCGDMQAVILAPSAGKVDEVRREIREHFRQYSAEQAELTGATPDLVGQPDKHWESTLRNSNMYPTNYTKIILTYCLVFFVLLLVPAISLSGMADSRMERRLAEMGVRRAFGAPAPLLMRQVLIENLFFTLLGGVVGLLISWILVSTGSNWLMSLGSMGIGLPPESTEQILTPAMLFNLPVFGIALVVCILLNLLSAFIPAWRASRHQIVDSLNLK
ncbi:MAG: ABC transporter permease [Tannerella sp.]|jgi:putative ABC transport system permease protein|nr:ABC transporter permease [Tannerella sp.]